MAMSAVERSINLKIPYHYIHQQNIRDERHKRLYNGRTYESDRRRDNVRENSVEIHMHQFDIYDITKNRPHDERERDPKDLWELLQEKDKRRARDANSVPRCSTTGNVVLPPRSKTANIRSRGKSAESSVSASRRNAVTEPDNIREQDNFGDDLSPAIRRVTHEYHVEEPQIAVVSNPENQYEGDEETWEADESDVPPLIDRSGNAIVFDPETFANSLTLDDRPYAAPRGAEERLNANSLCLKYFDMYSTDKSEEMVQKPAFRAVFKCDPIQFLADVVEFLEFPENGMCTPNCSCNLQLENIKETKINPLFLAVHHTDIKFFQLVTERDHASPRLEQLISRSGKRQQMNQLIGHYFETIKRWLTVRAGAGAVSVIDLAADMGILKSADPATLNISYTDRPALVDYLLHNTFVRTLLRRRPEKSRVQKYDVYGYAPYESLLSRIVSHPNLLERLSRESREFLIAETHFDQLPNVIQIASERGDLEVIELLRSSRPDDISEVMKKEKYLDWDYWKPAAPGKIQLVPTNEELALEQEVRKRNEHPECSQEEPAQAAHYIAWSGMYEKFARMNIDEKKALDYCQFSVLCPMLRFTDEQVLEQLNYFRDVNREDFFTFISNIILENRKELLVTCLQTAMAISTYFTPPVGKGYRVEVYEPYGFPTYIPLPLETALCRTGDMERVQKILEIYNNPGSYAFPMIEEDCVRCITFINDRAHIVSDQIRLAVILVMMPFVNPFSGRFPHVINMHLKQGNRDPVSTYIKKTFASAKDRQNVWKRGNAMKWAQAMDQAAKIVPTFNGSIEQSGMISYQLDLKPLESHVHNFVQTPGKSTITSQNLVGRRSKQRSEKAPTNNQVFLSLSLAYDKSALSAASGDLR